ARADLALAEADRAAQGARQQVFIVADRDAHAHARALADVGALARQVGQLGDHLGHVEGHPDLVAVGREGEALLLHDRDLMLERLGVVGADLRPEAVLERGDDAPAVRVVLGVRAGDDEQVERQADLVAADLDIALFHDVQQAHLDALGQVGQLVQAEDAAVRARQQPVMDRQLVRQVAPLGDLDRIDLPDEVGDSDVGRRELLAVAAVARQPGDLSEVVVLRNLLPARLADRLVGIVVDVAAGDDRGLLVQQVDQRAREARLCLAALAEENHVLPGHHGVFELRDDGLLVAHDARKQLLARPDQAREVAAHLLLDGDHLVLALTQLANRARLGHRSSCSRARAWASGAGTPYYTRRAAGKVKRRVRRDTRPAPRANGRDRYLRRPPAL